MERLVLIDGDSLLYYEAFKEQTFEEAKLNIFKRLKIILERTKTNKYAAFLSCSDNFRHSIAKTKKYKSGRTGNKPKLFYQLKDFTLNELGFKIIKKYEADDLVLYYSNKLKDKYKCIISSPDKDVLYQKEGTHFNYQFKKDKNDNFKSGEDIKVSEEDVAKFKNMQLLTGDSVDSVIGIPKIGEKTALKILNGVESSKQIYVVLYEYIKYFKNELIAINKLCENVNLLQMVNNDEIIEWFELPKLNDLPFIVTVNNLTDKDDK